MQRPWELPAYAEPGHAVPLGGGRWRGPRALDDRCTELLAERGIRPAGKLADRSAAWWIPKEALVAPAPAADGDPLDPEWRAAWIAARIAAGVAAWQEAPPAPRMLGILNLTPDSFSDGGALLDPGGALDAEALRAASARLADEGAGMLDLGAESTRPGASPVADPEQLAVLLPAIEALADGPLPLSVDTRSAAVAEACLAAGASWVNDVSGFADPAMAPLLARTGASAVLMHMRGTPQDMRDHARYRFLMGEVADELAAAAARALLAGVAPTALVLDPGIGFAKDALQSTVLVASGGALRALGYPLMFGPSRKSYLVATADASPDDPQARDRATVEAAATCGGQGAAWLRLHRGGPALEAARAAHAASFGSRGVAV